MQFEKFWFFSGQNAPDLGTWESGFYKTDKWSIFKRQSHKLSYNKMPLT